MSPIKVITSGSAYLDIDAYACCIAYAELLNLQGIPARAVSSAKTNASVSKTVLGWGAVLHNYRPTSNDEFVLVDVSDYHHFDPMVALDRVVEVIDHHPGFEKYWLDRLGPAADIRPIGAAATQVFERWEASGRLPLISTCGAALLATAILDNTLNFTSQMTRAADVRAYEILARSASLAVDWPERYFLECQESIEKDLCAALAVDLKRMKPETGLPAVFAQMTVWDAGRLIVENEVMISRWMAGQGDDWLLNIIGLCENRSFFLAGPDISQRKLGRLLPLEWRAGVAVAERSMLRKEILTLGLAMSEKAWPDGRSGQ